MSDRPKLVSVAPGPLMADGSDLQTIRDAQDRVRETLLNIGDLRVSFIAREAQLMQQNQQARGELQQLMKIAVRRAGGDETVTYRLNMATGEFEPVA